MDSLNCPWNSAPTNFRCFSLFPHPPTITIPSHSFSIHCTHYFRIHPPYLFPLTLSLFTALTIPASTHHIYSLSLFLYSLHSLSRNQFLSRLCRHLFTVSFLLLNSSINLTYPNLSTGQPCTLAHERSPEINSASSGNSASSTLYHWILSECIKWFSSLF